MIKYVLFFIIIVASNIQAQTNPSPFPLSNGFYSFTSWSPDAPAGTYPPNMMFHQTSIKDPKLSDEMQSDWLLAYNLSSRSRYLGLNELGFAFQNTSNPQDEDGAYLGAALLSLNASGRSSLQVKWTGRTIAAADRTYRIVLQYRIGESGEFISLPSEYSMSLEMNHSTEMPQITLQSECNNQPIVQLRWKYYYVESAVTGTRPQLAVDDILVTSSIYDSVEEGGQEFEIYGNILKIHGDYSSFKIYDFLGNVLHTSCEYSNSIDISHLASAPYLLVVSYGNTLKTYKFIK